MRAPARRVLLILSVPVLVLCVLAVVVAAPRLPALRSLLAFQDAVPDDLAEPLVAPEGFELLSDRTRYGVERAWLHRGQGPRAPVIVFVHGVAADGIADGRIIHAVRAFGQGGFTVLAPELPSLVDPLDPHEPGAGIVRLLEALARGAVADVDAGRVGVVGISVGGALALRGAAAYLQRGGSGLRAVLAIGAPDDMRRTSVAWFEAQDYAPESDGSLRWERRNAAAFARNFLIRAGLVDEFGRSEDVERLAAWMAADPLPATPLEGVSDPRVLAKATLLGAPPVARAAAREEVLRRAAARIEGLSPALWSDELAALRGVGIFLLHGHGDPLVPLEESRHLAARLRAHTIVSVLESHMVGHTSVNDVGLAERLAHVVQMDDFFDMIGG